MSLAPIKLHEHAQILQLGVNQSSIGFATVTIESERQVCIIEKTGDQNQVVIIDLLNQSTVTRYNIQADSARICPSSNVIALKASKTIQVYDPTNKAKICSHNLTEDIAFWKWISSTMIVIVTSASVYHWEVSEKNTPPVKIFDRHESLNGSQIISYKVDSNFQWFTLIGISAQQNRVAGCMQLYSASKNVSQPIEAHAAVFCDFVFGNNPKPSNVLAFFSKAGGGSKLHLIEVGSPEPGNQPFPKRSLDISLNPENSANDFPVYMHGDAKSGLIFLVTKEGYFHLFDIESGVNIFANRVSMDVIFTGASLLSGDGLISINRKGQVLSVSINSNDIVPYLLNKQKETVAFQVAQRGGYPGAEQAFIAKFNELFSRAMYSDAAKVACKAPMGMLRNENTINMFRNAPVQPGQPSPLLGYFSVLLETTQLNEVETLLLCEPVIVQGKKALVEKWLMEDKLTCSQRLGDLAKTIDTNLALSIFLRANCYNKVIEIFAETGQFDKIVAYSKKVGFSPDYVSILRVIVRKNPDAALTFAKSIVASGQRMAEFASVGDVFLEVNLIQQYTAFMLEALKGNLEEDGPLQTRLLETNLRAAPQVADAILGNNMFTHYDKSHIAQLCEQSGLVQRALEHYTDIYDIRRAIVMTHLVNPEWLVNYFGSLSVDDSLSCLRTMLESNLRQNLPIVVQVSAKYYEQLNTQSLIQLFESFKSSEGLFMFLSNIVNFSQDGDVHFKYIQAACKIGQFKEVERIVKESSCYDPEQVKNFLKDAKLSDQLPFIIVCDRFGYVNDLVLYLYKNNHLRYIEVFVQKVNPSRLPEVVGSLLDVDCGDEFIRNMIQSCPTQYSMDVLVEEVSKRNRMKLLLPVLESNIASGSTEPAFHTAMAIVCIDSNNRAENFLRENQYYDSLTVGRYCEKRDPQLACLAYERGNCDAELIRVCNQHSLFKSLAKYLVFRKNQDLWATVLNSDNPHRRMLIDQVVQSALLETQDPEDISETVKAFMAAELPSELIEILERLVLNNTIFSSLRNLQNLLFLTAIKADPSRLMDYINRLDNYDAPNIANVAIMAKHHEEAFSIYKKFENHNSAIQVLIDHIKNLDRAVEYAERCNVKSVWSILAKAQLDVEQVSECINSFIKASDPTSYKLVITKAVEKDEFENLTRYLAMARVLINDSNIDSHYALCMAKTGSVAKLEEFLMQPNNVPILATGELCFTQELYEAAKVLFRVASNYPRLASCYVRLKEYQAAVDSARKANHVTTWREVCFACVEAGEFKSAQVCAMNLVVHPDELEELIRFFETRGLFQELISLIESGIGLERAHMGMFTELAILYAKYRTSKLKEHLELFWSRVNIPKVIRAAENSHLWSAVVFLHEKYEEYEYAISTMMNHPGDAFSDTQFRDIINKVANTEYYYKAIKFYVSYNPSNLNELLIGLTSRLDHSRTVSVLSSLGVLSFAKPYLQHAQSANSTHINEALNDLYVEENSFDELETSITTYNNFDAVKFARTLESHKSVEFRRISNVIYKRCNKWDLSIEVAKKDGLYKDIIINVCDSRDSQLARSTLEYFVENKRPECVVALLYYCYDMIPPDFVMELCWVNGMLDCCMPFLIQTLSEYTKKVDCVETKQVQQETDAQPVSAQPIFAPQLMLTGGGAPIGGMNYAGNPFGGSGPTNNPQFRPGFSY